MPRVPRLLALMLLIGLGCRHASTNCPTPAQSGLNTRDLIDAVAQKEAEELTPGDQIAAAAENLRKERQRRLEDQSKREGGASSTRPDRNILCLSGGGSFGAYTAGVLIGWTEKGDRPAFDVVTGISTGALIAPFAFLGPKYDNALTAFYTMVTSKDIYRPMPVRGLFGESFADTTPLKRRIDAFLSPEVMCDLAAAHNSGRRLYVGTTEEEGKQFIVWDLGAMAVRNGPGDRERMIQILLGSASPPGFFPASKIDVEVDGVCHTERHVDGGVSQGVFFRPPYTPPEMRSDVAARDLAGAKVYCIIAGKLYADPEVIKPRALASASRNVSTVLYAQTRGDLQRLYTVCLLTGMDYFISSIPAEYPAPVKSSEFIPEVMGPLFEVGRKVMLSAKPWRTLPPGVGQGEAILERVGPTLTYAPRGPLVPIQGPKGISIPPMPPKSDKGSIPTVPFTMPVK